MCRYAQGSQKDFASPGISITGGCTTWVLGTELMASGRAGNALNQRHVSSYYFLRFIVIFLCNIFVLSVLCQKHRHICVSA